MKILRFKTHIVVDTFQRSLIYFCCECELKKVVQILLRNPKFQSFFLQIAFFVETLKINLPRNVISGFDVTWRN